MDKYCGKKLDGRYEIREVIGFGGMAVVYKAFDLATKQEVAVKILKDEFISNAELRRRFSNEAKAITVLNHPNIVKVFDVGLGETVQYIVMEYIYGITLKEYIAQQKTVYWKEAIHFTTQVLYALQHAHDNGIIHRDIKPQNIMLTPNGTIKVMDFGIARFQRDAGGRTIAGNKAVGSVHYISPEQARGGENTDPRSDLYSVGVMLYEMLTGTVPFDGETPVSIAMKHIQDEAQPVRKLNEKLPVGLEEIVTRAMQKDPDLRYQSAAEMLKDLDEFKRNPNVEFGYQYFAADGKTQIETENEGAEDDMKKKKKKKKAAYDGKKRSYLMPILLGITAACLIVAGIAVAVFFQGLGNRPGEMRMPDLVGMTTEQAAKDYPNFKFVIVAEELSATYEEGVIIETNPKEGTSVKESAEIKLTISKGLLQLEMPDLANYKQDEAVEALTDMGIPEGNISIVEKFSEDIDEGRVIETTPAKGESVDLNTGITLFVSMGDTAQTVTVPYVVGDKESEARAKLTDFTVMTVMVESDKESGTVVEQSLNRGDRVAKGSTITLSISNGVAPTNAVTVTIPIPSGAADGEYTFTGELDGKAAGSVKVNPSEVTSASLRVTGSEEDVTLVVYVTVDGAKQVYATYKVNFVEQVASLQGTVNGDLVMPHITETTVDFAVDTTTDHSINTPVTFYVYIDSVLSSSNTINPAVGSFKVSCTGSGTAGVVVTVDLGNGEQTYAEYKVDYNTSSVYATFGPDFALLQDYGEDEAADAEE